MFLRSKEKNSALKWILVIGIMVVLNLFFNYSIELIYDSPQWDTYCLQSQVTIQPRTQEDCVAQGGGWTDDGTRREIGGEATPKALTGYCDLNYTCGKTFEAVNSVYSRNVFTILVILGILSLVAGFFISGAEAVSLGLSLGGVLSFIIGSIRYWSNMDDYLRVIVLGLTLGILIWLGIKKLQD